MGARTTGLFLIAAAGMVCVLGCSMERGNVQEEFTGTASDLQRHVNYIAGEIGERHMGKLDAMNRCADYIEEQLQQHAYQVQRQSYDIVAKTFHNLVAELPGGARAEEILVIGAHYDTVPGCPGANDNTSAVAALLVLAERFARSTPARTIRFVAFANEEPPWFHTENMGSLVYARACRRRGDDIVAMIALETIGYYSDEPGSQQFPSPALASLYPATGNFIGFVGNTESQELVQQVHGLFEKSSSFPAEWIAYNESLPGIGWSDHWAFWQAGYKALMVTDTAPFRYPHYHQPTDTPDKIDYLRAGQVVDGMQAVLTELAR